MELTGSTRPRTESGCLSERILLGQRRMAPRRPRSCRASMPEPREVSIQAPDIEYLAAPPRSIWQVQWRNGHSWSLSECRSSAQATPAQHRFSSDSAVLSEGAEPGSPEETDHVQHSHRNRRLDWQHWAVCTLLGRRNLLPEQFKK